MYTDAPCYRLFIQCHKFCCWMADGNLLATIRLAVNNLPPPPPSHIPSFPTHPSPPLHPIQTFSAISVPFYRQKFIATVNPSSLTLANFMPLVLQGHLPCLATQQILKVLIKKMLCHVFVFLTTFVYKLPYNENSVVLTKRMQAEMEI